jgi:hypothetical protein
MLYRTPHKRIKLGLLNSTTRVQGKMPARALPCWAAVQQQHRGRVPVQLCVETQHSSGLSAWGVCHFRHWGFVWDFSIGRITSGSAAYRTDQLCGQQAVQLQLHLLLPPLRCRGCA